MIHKGNIINKKILFWFLYELLNGILGCCIYKKNIYINIYRLVRQWDSDSQFLVDRKNSHKIILYFMEEMSFIKDKRTPGNYSF